MLGNLYVAAKYWAWGYSDGMANAGASSKRKKYEIDGRIYWAHERELPDLLASMVRAPEPAKKQTVRAKAVKRPATKRSEQGEAQIAAPAVDRVAARLDALAAMFQPLQDQTLALALADVRHRIEQDEEEALMVILWH